MTTPLQFHSEYEIVKWLASRDNFDQGLAELRESLAAGTIVNGRNMVQKWLSVYDDVTTGRVVTSAAAPATGPAPVPDGPGQGSQRQGAGSTIGDSVALARMFQETRLWAEASREAAARADSRADSLEAHARKSSRLGAFGFVFALLALAGLALLVALLWPQIEPRWLAFVRPISGH